MMKSKRRLHCLLNDDFSFVYSCPTVSANGNVQKVIDETYVKPNYVLGYSLDQKSSQQTGLLNYDGSKR